MELASFECYGVMLNGRCFDDSITSNKFSVITLPFAHFDALLPELVIVWLYLKQHILYCILYNTQSIPLQ